MWIRNLGFICGSCLKELRDIFSSSSEFLNNVLPEQWVRWGGPTAWPDTNPDVIPLNVYFYGHLMCSVCGTEGSEVQDLQIRIQNGYDVIGRAPGILQRVRQSLFNVLVELLVTKVSFNTTIKQQLCL
jgi:hypothetical protein